MRPSAGTALGGRYRLDQPIAVGGMGEVWVAHDLSLRRSVAVKVLRDEFAGDPAFLERFRTEARNAASLSHPNIAATYDYGEQAGSSYLVMELVDGEPLSDLLEREHVLPEARLLPVLAQTARALDAAHAVGVVHRDVKPGNILLGPGGRVKITDFGVSTAPDQAPMTATGMVMGTAQYLSPEQAVGRPATALSDLYSLGVVAYESLTGKRPFTGPTAVDIAVAHVNTPVPPLPPHVSRPVADVVLRLLAKEPSDRPPSAGALARALDALLGRTSADGVPLADDVPRAVPSPSSPSAGVTPAEVTPAPAAASSAPAPVWPPVPPVETARPGPDRADLQRVAGTAGPRTVGPGGGPPPPSYPPRRALSDPRRAAAARPATPVDRAAPASGARAAPASTGPGPTRTPTAARGAPPPAPRRTGPRTAQAPVATPAPEGTPTRTSTTTGRRFGRFGRWSWPLIGLVALIAVLLGAALADSVGGSGPDGAAADAPVGVLRVAPEPGARGDDGMIDAGARPEVRTVRTLSTDKDA